MSWPRPAGVSTTAVVLGGVTAALVVIAATTGSGWTVVIIAGLAGLFIIGALWPALSLRGTRISVEAPPDATVKRPLPLHVRVWSDRTGPSAPALVMRVRGFEAPWTAAAHGDTGDIIVTPTRRGVVTTLSVDVKTSAPLGLVWWKANRVQRLPREIDVAPMPDTGDRLELETAATHSGDLARHRRGSDTFQRIREYMAGDSRKHIHWPATARHATMLTRELDDLTSPQLTIAVDLNGDADAAELAASRAAGLALAALDQGVHPTLATSESPSRPPGQDRESVVAEATSSVEVGRRLARALPGPAPAGLGEAPVLWVRAQDFTHEVRR